MIVVQSFHQPWIEPGGPSSKYDLEWSRHICFWKVFYRADVVLVRVFCVCSFNVSTFLFPSHLLSSIMPCLVLPCPALQDSALLRSALAIHACIIDAHSSYTVPYNNWYDMKTDAPKKTQKTSTHAFLCS